MDKKELMELMIETADGLDRVGLSKEASVLDNVLKKVAAEGINPAVYDLLDDAVRQGMSFEEAKENIEEQVDGWELSREDWEEMQEEQEK